MCPYNHAIPEQRLIFRFLFIIILFQVLLAGCGRNVQPNAGGETRESSARPAGISGTRVLSPANDQYFTLGDSIQTKLELIRDTLPEIDSVVFYIDGTRLQVCFEEPYEYAYLTGKMKVGSRPLRIIIWYADGRKEYHNLNIILRSDIVPENLSYRIENIWPHDVRAYTQGLIYEDGYLYEGTGQLTESSLRKIEIKTGDAVMVRNLPDDVFGEGITILDNKIFQLTYKSQVGFVYEKESFDRMKMDACSATVIWGTTPRTRSGDSKRKAEYMSRNAASNRIR